MPEQVVKRGETIKLGRVEGDLQVGRKATIKAESGGKVVVAGDVVFEGGATIDCSLECNAIETRAVPHTGGTVVVHGDLTVRESVDVADSLEVSGKATADGFDVGGHLQAEAVISKRVRVGGHVRISDIVESESVDVAGHLSVMGKVKIVDLHVGGHARVGGGAITGSTQIRGHFEANSNLEYGELQTFGHVSLPANSRGNRLSVLGRVEFEGDAYCKVMDVKGIVEVKGDLSTDELDVPGKMHVKGSLKVLNGLNILGLLEVGQRIDCQKLVVEGRLSAGSAFVVGEADVSGELKTSRGVKSSTITVRRGARVTGPLVAERVEVGEKPGFGQWPSPWSEVRQRIGQMTNVEDVYGRRVTIGAYSQAKHVFGDEVQIESGSVAEQVTYTKDLSLPSKFYIHEPPKKVPKLPDPPL
jgi:cytoskeletal protein CcmA (bactofilin family)